MRRMATIAAALAALTGPAHAGQTGGSDPFFGTWSLEPERSHYAQEEVPPQHMTLIIEPAPDGLAYRSDAQYAGGRTASSHYVAKFDGTPALVVGTIGFLAPVSLTRTGETAIAAVYTSGLKKVAWSRWTLNPAATELLVTTTFIDRQGEEKQNVAAFRRVEL